MKVKSRIWLGYSFFALLFILSILWLLVELKGFSNSVSGYIRNDISALKGVSEQFQDLEDVYSLYLTLFIPSDRPISDKFGQVNRARLKFIKDWKHLTGGIGLSKKYSGINKLVDKIYRFIHFRKDKFSEDTDNKEISRIKKNIDKQWKAVNRYILDSIKSFKKNRPSDAGYVRKTRVSLLKKKIGVNLNKLQKIYEKRSQQKSRDIIEYTNTTYKVIPYFFAILLILLIIVAIVFSNRLSKPLISLKEAIDQVSVQDYNINIKNKTNDEIGELSSAFEQLAERLRDSGKYITLMLSQFTHEMKDPIGATIQATRLLLKSADTTKQQLKFLKIIESNSERLKKLINNILHSSTYDIDTIKLNYDFVDIAKVLSKVIEDLSLNIEKKKIRIIARSFPDQIMCEIDSDKMEEVFQNLISNAVKFSKEGSKIIIGMKLNVSVIRFGIQDQGIGIPPKEIPYVFEKMYRASNSKNISVKGTGLGLFITSHIIRAHGGKITVKSTLGKGTTFNIRLPRTRKIAVEGGWFES